MFSFTSLGGKIDHGKNKGGSPYCFVLSGLSTIGWEVYCLMKVNDTEHEIANRISAVRYAY